MCLFQALSIRWVWTEVYLQNANKEESRSDNNSNVLLTERSIWTALWMTSRYWKSTMQPVTETYV